MHISLILDKPIFHDLISGYIEVSNSRCSSSDKPYNGYVKLSVVVILNAHMGWLTKRMVVLFEEMKEIQISQDVVSPFEFCLSDIAKKRNIYLPDSYIGFGVEVCYIVTACCNSFLHYSKVRKLALVKAEKAIQDNPNDVYINKNNINDFDGLLCSSSDDFVPEVHISCHLYSTVIKMNGCLSGYVVINQCNMSIYNISVGIVQNESMLIRSSSRKLQIVRETMEIATGDCPRNKEIHFQFFPDYSCLSSDYKCNDFEITFSLRVKVLFTNQFYCIKYIPIHFVW